MRRSQILEGTSSLLKDTVATSPNLPEKMSS